MTEFNVYKCLDRTDPQYCIQYTTDMEITDFITEVYEIFGEECGDFEVKNDEIIFTPYWYGFDKEDSLYISPNTWFVGEEYDLKQVLTDKEFCEEYILLGEMEE